MAPVTSGRRNTQATAFSASNFSLGVDTASLVQTFNDDFNGFSRFSDGEGIWRTRFEWWGDGAFTLAQNEFLYALLFLNTSTIRTVPVGVTGELIRGDAFYWGQLMAAAFLGSLPVVLIYSFFVKYYVAGLTAGSVKG